MKLADLKTRFRALTASTLVMNAFYLMLSTLVVAVSGFVFWVLIARSYSSAPVGLATTLLSISSLLALLGLAGFDTTFVRFLPGTDRKNDYINSGFIVVTVISAALSICSGLVLPHMLPDLSLLNSPWALAGFVFFTVVTALNTVTNAVFLSFKKAGYTFVINTLFSMVKIVLPLLAFGGGAMAIFYMAGIAQLVGLILSVAWINRKFGYQFHPRLHVEALRVVKKFSLSVYASSILNLLPPTILPMIVLHFMSPSDAAYYYMAFAIAGVLYTIAYASMQSVFAEGSHNEAVMRNCLAKAIKLVVALLLPAAFLTAVASTFWLTMFGTEYAQGAATLLKLFALSALPVAAYSMFGAIFKVTKNLRGVVGMNIIYAVVILGLSYLLVPHLGLAGIGWAWAAGNSAAAATGVYFLSKNINKRGTFYGQTTSTRR